MSSYEIRVGSRVQVMNGTAKQTSGGLKKSDLKYNKRGDIVSREKSNIVRPLKNKLKKNEFYCVGCRCRCVGEGIREAVARKTRQPMLKARCHSCESKVCKFIR